METVFRYFLEKKFDASVIFRLVSASGASNYFFNVSLRTV